MNPHTQPTTIIDSDHESVAAFAKKNAGNSTDPEKQAVSLYYAVRDGIRYDPYDFNPTVGGMRASLTLKKRRGWCVLKATLLTACCRALGIPARVGFADVKNHLSTQRLREAMKTDIFYWHGYASIHLNGAWIKATPAFNIELCRRFKLKPLEFDGKTDSLLHPFDLKGEQHMEYLNDRGEYDDVPLDEISKTFVEKYQGALFLKNWDFDEDVKQETLT
ncbi:Transglutaminase [Candidatus Desulfarcum epimagneticum]|uniref:Transglutaminase n=1 Tax=uncultured Desulfobacteraceae bacterium TaxID=218296 RepID=A0A484HE87_9BACT|nr:Transglutaminase [uncultured Desulfobacteraceae bacterium]